MHLAILSLNRGTPCITLSTQGKVAGLFQMLSIRQFCVDPEKGMAPAVIEVLGDIDAVMKNARAKIHAFIPALRELAKKNYEGLDEGVIPPIRNAQRASH